MHARRNALTPVGEREVLVASTATRDARKPAPRLVPLKANERGRPQLAANGAPLGGTSRIGNPTPELRRPVAMGRLGVDVMY